jgi:YebC/PmpR family DNA-binding regulatory protein
LEEFVAGHSQFKNIMHRKGAQDKKRAKLFTKLIREVIVAAKQGSDPDSNSRLRGAMHAARVANLPKDRILSAINKADGASEMDNLEEVRYEGYGPGGIAIIVEALTDNRNRTASEVRSSFTKSGGNLGETGSVSFMFTKLGVIKYNKIDATEAMMEMALEAEALDCMEFEEEFEIYTDPEDLHRVAEMFDKKFGPASSVELSWKPNTQSEVSVEDGQKLIKMLEALEDCDDVQSVFGNFMLPTDFEK